MSDKKTLKTFGYIWALILLFFAFKSEMKSIFLACSLFFFISATLFPSIYIKTGIFQSWVKVGNFIGHINSKIIIFFLFFFIFTPIALILKLFGKDLLEKKLDSSCKSYFKPRTLQQGSMKNQY